jgi:hypothetical protein
MFQQTARGICIVGDGRHSPAPTTMGAVRQEASLPLILADEARRDHNVSFFGFTWKDMGDPTNGREQECAKSSTGYYIPFSRTLLDRYRTGVRAIKLDGRDNIMCLTRRPAAVVNIVVCRREAFIQPSTTAR